MDLAENSLPVPEAPGMVDNIFWPINYNQAKLFGTSLLGK